MRDLSRTAIRRIRRHDRIARWVITLGGAMIIASVVAIVVLIVGVTLPLFRAARSEEVARSPLPEGVARQDVLAVGVELGMGEQGNSTLASYLLLRDGSVVFTDPHRQKVLGRERIQVPGGKSEHTESRVDSESGAIGVSPVSSPAPAGRQWHPEGGIHVGIKSIEAAECHAGSRHSLLWSDGSVSLVEVALVPELDSRGNRHMRGTVRELGEMPAEVGPPARLALMRASEAGGAVCVRLTGDRRLSVARQVVEENLLGDSTTKVTSTVIEEDIPGRITALAMDREGQTLYAGTDNGRILVWKLDDQGSVARGKIVPAFHDKRAITSLAMVLGDVSLAVGDAKGGVSTWFAIPRNGKRDLSRAHTLASHDGPVLKILPSQRNKSLLSLGQEGSIHLDYPTSERHLLSINAGSKESPALLGYSTRGNAAVALDEHGELVAWQIDAPYPEVSWTTLFGKVLYEGYSEPVYAWQTTGGSDFEPKFSLVPVLFGTLKGTFYAMLLAVPLALLGAAYTSQFTTPGFKAVVKPVVETMAAIPSVVIGFLIALWLAPIVDRWILAVFASLATVPLVFVAFMGLWQILRRFDWAKRVEGGYEFLAVVPILLAGVGLAMLLAPMLENWLFDGNFKQWLYEAMHTRFDQRNSIVIAFGLGLAVIPIIFSIAEDSLSTVPHSLTAASMALGASRWQTLWRVVLPSGSPGIFAGTMIGFGRAVGETMIVLMATGNTPILDWSPLNGMRTLSANIAVEIPEAPVGGTLYRVLFLCAVLLFLLTFILNTVAELVRQRLRKRYGRL